MKKSFINNFKHKRKAFTLIELAVVLIVVSILVTGSLSTLENVGRKSKEKITKDRIEVIYKAMGNYLRTRGHLPCPAPITDIKKSNLYAIDPNAPDSNCFGLDPDNGPYYGIYKSNISGSKLMYGMVPVQSLGLDKDFAQDGFNNKFSYVVQTPFTSVAESGPSSNGYTFFDADHENIITIKDITSNNSEQVSTTDAIFVIISHGANGFGAFAINSTKQNKRSSDSNELDNDATSFINQYPIGVNTASFDNEFVASAESNDRFDDIVFYKTRNELVTDFKALDKISCRNDGPNHDDVIYGATQMEWPKAQYGQVVAATGPNSGFCPAGYTSSVVKPTKKCGAFGIWEESTVDGCLQN